MHCLLCDRGTGSEVCSREETDDIMSYGGMAMGIGFVIGIEILFKNIISDSTLYQDEVLHS